MTALCLLALVSARLAYQLGGIFILADLILVLSAALIFNGRLYSAYALACAAGIMADLSAMPFFGLYFFTYAASVTALWVLTMNLYRENYLTKVVIVAFGASFFWMFYSTLVLIFHWGLKLHHLSFMPVPRVLLTTVAAALAFKIAEMTGGNALKWSGTTSRKT